MPRISFTFLVLLALFLSACAATTKAGQETPTVIAPAQAQAASSQSYDLSPQELTARLQNNPPPLLIDVREPQEVASFSFADSKNIPLGELEQHLETLDKEQEIILVCRSGRRSTQARQLMEQAGFKHVYNLRGGIQAWIAEMGNTQPASANK